MNRLVLRTAAAVAALIFVLNPLVHLHFRPPVPHEGALSSPAGASVGCVACLFGTNVAIATTTQSVVEPPQATAGSATIQPRLDARLSIFALVSRAPPALS